MVHFISRRTSWWQTGTIAPEPKYLVATGQQQADEVSAGAWLSQVRGQSQNGDVLVVVHGFNTNRNGALETAKLIKAAVGAMHYKGAVVAYDWPTSSEDGLRGFLNKLLGLARLYKKDKQTANDMDDKLVRDLQFLFEADGLNVHILAHSMGCYLTTLGIGHAEQWLGLRAPFDQIVFGAADVDRELLVPDKWGGKALNRRCARVTHYNSAHDEVLDIGGKIIFGGSKRSGRHGLEPGAPDRFIGVSMGERYGVAHPKHEQSTRLSHNWYLRDGKWLADLVLTLQGKDETAMPTRRADAGNWILKET